MHFMIETLLTTYIGQKASARVLAGRVRRGSGERIEAVIFVTDLRRFTALSDRLPSKQVLQVLNQVFDLIVTSIRAEGGEVLKFLGDGLLAIFSVKTCGGAARATECALKVTDVIMTKLGKLNATRSSKQLDPLELGIGLHLGPVFFGNVGAEERLDFTAVGPAVNLAFRLETLTKKVGRTIVVSAEFAAACPIQMQPLGQYVLGHSEKTEPVFTSILS
jgi:adenylate cyclase